MILYLVFLPLFVVLFNNCENYINFLCEEYFCDNIIKSIKNEDSILTKKYRVVNFSKSTLLGVLSIPTFYLLRDVIFYPEDVNYMIVSLFAALYTSIDMAALIYNSKNHISTNVHHIVVQFLYLYIYYYDFAMINLVRPIVAYACYSVFAYLVNGRLSIRKLNLDSEIIINNLSLVIYINTSILNWITQLYLLFFATPELPFLYTKMIYTALMLLIVSDDIFLMKYLYNYNRQIKSD